MQSRAHSFHAPTHLRLGLLLLAPLLLVARVADADDGAATSRPGSSGHESRAAAVARMERAAKRACLTGDPAQGVALLTDLYLDTNIPTYIYNQGRCFEQNHRYEDAIARFREYLVKAKKLSAEEKADTDKHIADCQSYLSGNGGQATRPETAGANEPPAHGEPQIRAEPAAHAEPPALVVTSQPPATRPGAGLRTAGLITAGVGVAGVVAGLALNLQVNHMSTQLENDYDPDLASRRTGYKTLGWIGYGAGSACLLAGSILYYLGWRSDSSHAPVALLPTLTPDMAGTALRGAF